MGTAKLADLTPEEVEQQRLAINRLGARMAGEHEDRFLADNPWAWLPAATLEGLDIAQDYFVRKPLEEIGLTGAIEALPEWAGKTFPDSALAEYGPAVLGAGYEGVKEVVLDPFMVAGYGAKAVKYAPRALRLAKKAASGAREAYLASDLASEAGALFPKGRGLQRSEEIARKSKLGPPVTAKQPSGVVYADALKPDDPVDFSNLPRAYRKAKAKAAGVRTAVAAELARQGVMDDKLADDIMAAVYDPYASPELSELLTGNRLKRTGRAKAGDKDAIRNAVSAAVGRGGLHMTGGAYLQGTELYPVAGLGKEGNRAQFGANYLLPGSKVKGQLSTKMELAKRIRDIDWAKSPELMAGIVEAFAKAAHMGPWYGPKGQMGDIAQSLGKTREFGEDPARLLGHFPEDADIVAPHARNTSLVGGGSTNSSVPVERGRVSGAHALMEQIISERGIEGLRNATPKELEKMLSVLGAEAKGEYAARAGLEATGKGFGLEDTMAKNVKDIASGLYVPPTKKLSGDPFKIWSYVANHFGNKGTFTADRHMVDEALSFIYIHAQQTGNKDLERLVEIANAEGEAGKHALADMVFKSLHDFMNANIDQLPTELKTALQAGEGLSGTQAIGWGSKNALIDMGLVINPSDYTETVNRGGKFVDVFHPKGEVGGKVATDTRLGSGSTAHDIQRHQIATVLGIDPYSEEAAIISGQIYRGKQVLPPPLAGAK